MPVLYAKIAGAWVPLNFAAPPEVAIGNTTPAGTETLWIDSSTNPPTTKAWVGGAWVVVGAIAPNEVWVGTTDPGDAAVELWYDTDATGAPALGGSLPTFTTWAALLASASPTIVGSQAWVAEWNVMAYWNGTTWVVPRGTRLKVFAETQLWNPTYMNGFLDINVWDDNTPYPFPTVSTVTMSAIYMLPDRNATVSAFLYSNAFPAPSGGGGKLYGASNVVAGTGAVWNHIGDMQGAQHLAANGTMIWVGRFNGVTGGTTAFGLTYVIFGERLVA